MMKKWASLLLALIMVFSAGTAVFAEGDDDGDDSVQIPVEGPEEDGEEETEGIGMELRPLADGDEGDDVLFLQMRLKSLKYFEGEENGKYGKDTQAAVRRFQEDNANRGLEATGTADEATQILIASARYRGLRYGSEGEDVKELQTRLAALGYYTGKISGKYLEGTQNGIRQFQKNNSLEATGIADPLTQEIIYSDHAVGRHDVWAILTGRSPETTRTRRQKPSRRSRSRTESALPAGWTRRPGT